ncbi:MAG: TonB-dependent receptor [Bryobacterales bacterium]|nr:TonB-dependent receptor [Bryobacterales bacterium]
MLEIRRHGLCVIVTLLMPGCGAILRGQTANTGVFLGTVRDQSGAAVTEAVVRVASPLYRRETVTNAEGNYQLLQVPAGDYRIEIEKEGFQRTVRSAVPLSTGQTLRVDGVLTVGAVTETVTVEGQVAQVDTATANVGSTIFGTQVQELALTTRSFTQLMTLQPGVNSSQAQQPGFGSNTSVPFSFNGGGTSSNNWTLDGGRNIDTYNGNNLTMVNLDAIAEVRIERNAYSAEYGRNAGAQVNVITRSGTNQLHGSLFEFFRNDKLDARNFFARSRPKNRYNNFGGTVGGPLMRDKLFFFLSNEYRRIFQVTSTRTGIVPAAEQVSGDFTGGRAIRDPDNGQAFPGNRIPAGRLDPNAQVLLRNYYAQPTPGFRQGALNFTSSEPDGTRYRSGLGRLDYNVRPNLTIFGRYNIDSTRLLSPYGLFANNVMPSVAASEQAHIMYTANGSANWTISPTLLNQFTTAWYHGSMGISTTPFASRTRVPGIAIPRVFDQPTDSAGFIPGITMAQGYAGVQLLWPQNISHYSYELIDNLNWVRGRHTFKFGGSIDKENKTQNQSSPNNNGTFTFDGSATGDALADLVLGRAFQYTENSSHITGSVRFTNIGLYLQDQYRATARLTLTAGLRWEFFEPEKDRNGTISHFNPAAFDPAGAPVVLPNGQIEPGTENFGNGVIVAAENARFGYAVTNTRYSTFAPRAGFSYALTGDHLTVLRGGFGMFHDRWSQFVSSTRGNYPFNQSFSIFNTLMRNPSQGTRRVFPIGLSSFNSPWEIPYLQKWSFGVQRQLPAELLLDVGYVGSKGTHLIRQRDINQPRPSAAVAGGQISPNAVRPFPGFASINTFETTANSVYHSLQASLVRRFSRGLAFQGSYTWSKSLDDAVMPLDGYAANRVERALAGVDRTHVLVVNYIWELPFGRNIRGWAGKLVRGWQISGISSFQSGTPLTIGISGDRAGIGRGSQRPDVIGQAARLKTLARWFNTDAFAVPALGTFGNAGRGLVRGPGINNWDVSAGKRTALTENVDLQFRAEFFNIFNHAQFSGVGTTVGAGTYGQVTGARDPRITQLGLRLAF